MKSEKTLWFAVICVKVSSVSRYKASLDRRIGRSGSISEKTWQKNIWRIELQPLISGKWRKMHLNYRMTVSGQIFNTLFSLRRLQQTTQHFNCSSALITGAILSS